MNEDCKSRIFVFGSNLAGRHGKGAALYARNNHGAVYGQGQGRQGDSYAIPTKNEKLQPLSLDDIVYWCGRFMDYAEIHPELHFDLTPIGCGLAGYKRDQIKPFFYDKPDNVHFTKEWGDE